MQFLPHPLLPNGHLQTLAGLLGQSRFWRKERAILWRVPLADGDQLVLHDDCPEGWRPEDRSALLIHGLAGCHASPYMRRIAEKLNLRGVRTFRLDLRGCGAGQGLSRLPYHSGRSADAAAALEKIAELGPGSRTSLIGFSLGGNIALKLLGESAAALPGHLDRAVAVCPPVDLAACVDSLKRGLGRWYDRHFVRLLLAQLASQRRLLPDSPALARGIRPRGIREFDDAFTAPVCGFGTAANYYKQCSSAQFVPHIQVPTLILAAGDDPLIPAAIFANLSRPSAVELCLTGSGGHLGYIGRRNGDPDRRWMDWRIIDWVLS